VRRLAIALSGLLLSAFGYRHPWWWDWLVLGALLLGWPIYYMLRRRARRDAAGQDGSP